MGHTPDSGREYRLLRRRLDSFATGAPDSPALAKILRLLYSRQDAGLAGKLSGRPTALAVLAQRLDLPADKLSGTLSGMARRGLVIDLEHNGTRYFALAPIVIGFFEFTFMRARPDTPMDELARLFDEYMETDDRFARAVFRGQAQIGRALVREEALPGGGDCEVLDWERASRVVESASEIGVSLCACRHKESHLNKACNRPLKTCLSFGYSARSFIHSGFAEPIAARGAMKILEDCKLAGMMQIGDNVQKKVAYICNCCGCCCGMIRAIRTFDIRDAVVTSNWIMEVGRACKGCGACLKACPVGAIKLSEERSGGGLGCRAVRDETLCLGCGVCPSACKSGALSMKPREQP
ncbi:MAG: 4Fe-4S dicluster domain-containing protein [Elusimicrobia bacterium]|nr:4Fe-4S dicluster domain-containing protein [Elusimicrobiota bacterium]